MRSTVPAEELSRLRHAPLPPSKALFPPTLLDTALSKTRAASNDALVHKALQPPRIPKRQPQQQNRASSSSAAPADRSGVSPLVPRQQQAQRGNASAASSSGGNCNRPRKGKKPFRHSSGRPGKARGGGKGSGKRQNWPGSDANTGGGGCLSLHWRQWQATGANQWVVSVLRDGYRILFRHQLPPLAYAPVLFPTYPFDSPKALALRQEVEIMISKGALESLRSGSRLLQPSLPGGKGVRRLETVINEFVQQTPFKMETASSVLLSVRKGDFLASIDLKDASFQISVHVSSRKWLRFVSNGTVHQFRVLCFGLSTAPQVFTRVFATVSAWAHARGVCLLRYLDDWLVLASVQHVRDLLSLCNSLGVVLNREKSDLSLSQSVEYLGMTIDTVAARAYPTLPRIDKFIATARKFLARRDPPAQRWQVLLGHMSSLEKLVHCGRLRMCSLQWHLKSHWSLERDPPNHPVPAGRGGPLLVGGEGPPTRGDTLRNPNPGPPPILWCVPSGLGSSPPWPVGVGSMVTPGELVAHQSPGVKRPVPGTRAFRHLVTDRRVTAMCNNSIVVAYVNKQGGTVSWLPLLIDRATSPMDRVQLEARYLPGQSNVLADLLSRRNQILGAEWSLHLQVARDLLRKWGSPTLDLFATHTNAKLPLYCSLIPDPQALFEDAFRHPWDNLDTYAFPPFQLVERVVARVRETPNLSMTLVTPLWPEKAWFAELHPLLTQPPLALPLWDRLLRQPHFHSTVSTEASTPWTFMRGGCQASPQKVRLFERSCARIVQLCQSPLHTYTSRNGSLSVVGVVEGALL